MIDFHISNSKEDKLIKISNFICKETLSEVVETSSAFFSLSPLASNVIL